MELHEKCANFHSYLYDGMIHFSRCPFARDSKCLRWYLFMAPIRSVCEGEGAGKGEGVQELSGVELTKHNHCYVNRAK